MNAKTLNMTEMNKKLFSSLLLSALVAIPSVGGSLSVKYPCSDAMVLQQNTSVLIWGHAAPGSVVKLCPSWTRKEYSCTTDADSVWRARVATPRASYTNYVVDIRCGREHLAIRDVLVGEVWVASGQSNMEMPLRGFHNCPVEGYLETLCSAAAPDRIRMFTVGVDSAEEPLSDVRRPSLWRKASVSTLGEMSAVAYFFARTLNEALDVPVGILALPRGGTRVEGWLPRSTVEDYGTEDCSATSQMQFDDCMRAYMMYNAMEQPVCGYTARGFIWYQGCSNVGAHERFAARMEDLARQWRSDWGDTLAAMPFYQVEIAPYEYGDGPDGESGALLREAQHKCADSIPNSAIVCTNDLVYPYESGNIHPCRKAEVGLRLAALALHRDYGFAMVPCYSPRADSVGVDPENPSCLLVHLSDCIGGLDRTKDIRGLEIAGEDGIFHPVHEVEMVWQEDIMKVSSPQVPRPACVRYGWGNFRPGNLHSSDGLPLVPFVQSVGEVPLGKR